jgi:tartrate dehydrogenase/decarboxylase/D-malate dehydrogenase
VQRIALRPKGLRVLETATSAFDFTLDYEHFDYASADYYTKPVRCCPPAGSTS